MCPKHYQMCCRLCLGTAKEQLEIFAVPDLPEMLQTLYKLKITLSDECSTWICVDCYYEAKVSCNWLRVHRKLMQQIDANQTIFVHELELQEAFQEPVVNVSEPVENKEFFCKICGVFWKSKKLLRKHLSKQHQIPRNLLKGGQWIIYATENNPFRCEICSTVFSDERTLCHHQLKVHMIGTGQPSKPVPERQPAKKVNHSRSTRAMEIYPTERTARRSKSICSPAELLQPGQQPSAFRTRSKSQDLEKLLAQAESLKSTGRSVNRFFCDNGGNGNGSKYRVVRRPVPIDVKPRKGSTIGS